MAQQQIPVMCAKCSTYLSSQTVLRGHCPFAQEEAEAQKSRGVLALWAQLHLWGVRGNWHFLLPLCQEGFASSLDRGDVCYAELLLDQMWVTTLISCSGLEGICQFAFSPWFCQFWVDMNHKLRQGLGFFCFEAKPTGITWFPSVARIHPEYFRFCFFILRWVPAGQENAS